MRVSFFTTSTVFSGGRLMMCRHAEELARRGHDVCLWVEQDAPRLDWMKLNIPVRGFSRRGLSALPRVDVCVFERIRLARPLVDARRGPVVHFCQGFEGTDTALRLRSVREEHGLLRGLPKLFRLWRRLRAIERAYRLPTTKFVVHPHLGELLARRFGQSSHLVPCGLPADVFTPPASRPSAARTILVVGPTDIAWKRIADALEAVRRLKTRRPELRLVRVAQHPMRDGERALNVSDEYHTMVTPPQMAELYRGADVLLCPSNATEGFGLPVLEALASGLPSVVSDIPAFRTFARPADYAHFVKVGDIAAMASAMDRLLDDAAERRRLSGRGVQVAAGYTMWRSYDAMEQGLMNLRTGAGAA